METKPKSPLFVKRHFEMLAAHLATNGGTTDVYKLAKFLEDFNPKFRADLFIAKSTFGAKL